jgi:predicted transcriptional regulator
VFTHVDAGVAFKEEIDKRIRALPVVQSPELIRAMVQAHVITAMQGKFLRLRLAGKTLREIAAALGMSQRSLRRLAEAGYRPSRPSPLNAGTVIARKVKGERRWRYYKVIKQRFGDWEQTLLELTREPATNIEPVMSKSKWV